jgi:hypothetical protein
VGHLPESLVKQAVKQEIKQSKRDAIMNRPTLTQAMKLEAANKVVEMLNSNTVTAAQVAKYYHQDMDGFELAKKLERECNCDFIFDDVEILDQMSSYASDVLLQAEKQWVLEYDIKPPYEIGTRTTKGTISDIYQYSPASYEIKPYGQDDESCGNKRWIVKFEHVELKAEVAA